MPAVNQERIRAREMVVLHWFALFPDQPIDTIKQESSLGVSDAAKREFRVFMPMLLVSENGSMSSLLSVAFHTITILMCKTEKLQRNTLVLCRKLTLMTTFLLVFSNVLSFDKKHSSRAGNV